MIADNAHKSVQEAFIHELRHVMNAGEEIEVRGSKVKEVFNRTISICNPRYRCLMVPHRNDNIFAKIAETLWMLAGRDDIEWLKRYVPRAADFSDNGRTWRGAYGPRLRNWNGNDNVVDQVHAMLNLLQKDPNTRRAIISLWDPSIDWLDSKDIPCNNWLHFFIRDNMLHLNIAQRSSDVFWGFSGIDAFSWSVLLEFMAHALKVDVGIMTFFISNLHIYERHWARAMNVLESYREKQDVLYEYIVDPLEFNVPSIQDLDEDLGNIFALEESYVENVGCRNCDFPNDRFLAGCANMLYLYSMHMNNRSPDDIALMIGSMPTSDFKIAAIDYFHRTIGDDFKKSLLEKAGLTHHESVVFENLIERQHAL